MREEEGLPVFSVICPSSYSLTGAIWQWSTFSDTLIGGIGEGIL
jgi:hypothetical protein